MRRGLTRLGLSLASLAVAVVVWASAAHLVFAPDLDDWVSDDVVAPRADAMAQRYLHLWSDTEALADEHGFIRMSNPEWDFMGRTFLVLSLANIALREPAREEACLAVIDAVIDDTLAQERAHGVHHFLMAYSRYAPFVVQPEASVFVDGEIALMIGARRMVRDRDDLAAEHSRRVDEIIGRMSLSPVLSAESYPDECWTFCNTVALAAIRMHDVLDGTDHDVFLRRWVETAREHLVDEDTGLLVSSFTVDGQHLDGPEGSSIYMAAHCLMIVDEAFAWDQYARARRELGRTPLGFGFSREWPQSWSGPQDVDSGPIIPVVGASPGASGLAVLGASAFDDTAFLKPLLTSLRLGGFPVRRDGELSFAASNHVGDAVILYALVQGPLWDRARQGGAS
jgi:hypothetical protein